MVNRNLMRQVDLDEAQMESEINAAFATAVADPAHGWLPADTQVFEVNKIVKGRVLNVVGDEVWVDVGYKSEGVIPVNEWYDEGEDKVVPPKQGDEIQGLLDAGAHESGAIVLTY